jgi:hypothetical protein
MIRFDTRLAVESRQTVPRPYYPSGFGASPCDIGYFCLHDRAMNCAATMLG